MGVVSRRGRKEQLVVAAAAFACCLLISNALPLRGEGEVSEDVAEEFWDQYVKPSVSSYGGTEAMTPLERSILAKVTKDKKRTKDLKYGGIGAAAGGGLLALLAPMLRLRSTENYVAKAREAPQVGLPGEKDGPPPSVDENEELPLKQPGLAKRLKRFFTPSKDVDWPKRGSKVAAVAATALMLGGLALLVASHIKSKRIKKGRRKVRDLIARQRRDLETDCDTPPPPPPYEWSMRDMLEQIEAATHPTGPLNTPPPSP